jgi:hypothetical protein
VVAGTRISWAIAALASLLSSPAAAEGFATLWSLHDVTATPPTSTALEQPFFEQRILPYRLVKLDQDVTTAAGKPVAKGSLLYLVLDKKNRQAFCTFKDSSTGNVAKSAFIPALDKRPCFIDDDRDGKFEKSFSVFEAWGTVVPEARGNMAKSSPVSPTSYSDVDRQSAPTDYRLMLHVFKRGKIPVPELRFRFSGKNDSLMHTARSINAGDATLSSPFNHLVRMKLDPASGATVSMTATGQDFMFVLNDIYLMLKAQELSGLLGGAKQ